MSEQKPLLNPEERVLSTLNQDGSRRWLRPKVARGKWWKRRAIVGYGLIALFNILPWLSINGKPILLLDVMHRQFTFFTFTFRPTETLLLAFLLLATFVSVFFITSLFGRVWCGWGCPQTVYLEFLYRPLERLIEGPNSQKGKPVPPKRVALKYLVFGIVSLHLSHTFLAYFVSPTELFSWTLGNPFDHPVGFGIVFGVAALMMYNFVWFREQMCILACPYGRLQAVLLDRNSLIVGYDATRGEPRGKKRKKADPNAPTPGDCIDCNWCLAVCPTGIDIRDGLQMECIHCTECVDACDNVMEKVGREKGLIRYTSQHGLAGDPLKFLRPRTVLYPIVIVLALSAFLFRLTTLETALISPRRVQNNPYTMIGEESVRNVLSFRIENRSQEPHTYQVEMDEPFKLVAPNFPLDLGAGQSQEFMLIVDSPVDVFQDGKARLQFKFSDEADFESEVSRAVVGPLTTSSE